MSDEEVTGKMLYLIYVILDFMTPSRGHGVSLVK